MSKTVTMRLLIFGLDFEDHVCEIRDTHDKISRALDWRSSQILTSCRHASFTPHSLEHSASNCSSRSTTQCFGNVPAKTIMMPLRSTYDRDRWWLAKHAGTSVACDGPARKPLAETTTNVRRRLRCDYLGWRALHACLSPFIVQ